MFPYLGNIPNVITHVSPAEYASCASIVGEFMTHPTQWHTQLYDTS